MPSKKKIDFQINENGCFVVTSHRPNKDGYFYSRFEGRCQRSHRLVYRECFGEIPEGFVVRHKCDNRGCINPEHLELGTCKDNIRDALERNRFAIGERNGSSKINEETARNIKLMLKTGMYPTAIARELGVPLKTVRGIKEYGTWSHVAI